MLLSVVMPVYNERETLFEIIRRVLAVPLPIEREFVLVDDFSRDGTRRETARRFDCATMGASTAVTARARARRLEDSDGSTVGGFGG